MDGQLFVLIKDEELKSQAQKGQRTHAFRSESGVARYFQLKNFILTCLNNHGASETINKLHIGISKVYDIDTWPQSMNGQDTYLIGERDILINCGVTGIGNEIDSYLHLRAITHHEKMEWMRALKHAQMQYLKNQTLKKELKERQKLMVPRQQYSARTLLEEDQFHTTQPILETDYQEHFQERQQVKSKFGAFYKKIGWSLKRKPLDIETILNDQVQFEVYTSESIQLNFSTNIFSKRSEYQMEVKRCKRLTHRIDCGIDKLVQNLMKSKKNAELICQLCEDFDQMKVIQKQFTSEVEQHHANMLIGSRRLVKMRNALHEHVIDREFHIPTNKKVKIKRDTALDYEFGRTRSNSAAMKLKYNQKTVVYQKIRKQTIATKKGEKSMVHLDLFGKEGGSRKSLPQQKAKSCRSTAKQKPNDKDKNDSNIIDDDYDREKEINQLLDMRAAAAPKTRTKRNLQMSNKKSAQVKQELLMDESNNEIKSKQFESDKKEDVQQKRSTKNVKYDLKTGQLMLDSIKDGTVQRDISPSNQIVEKSPLPKNIKMDQQEEEDAKFEESKSESNQIVEKQNNNSPGVIQKSNIQNKSDNKIQVTDTDMSNLQIVNQVSFGSRKQIEIEGDPNLMFPEEEGHAMAAFGFDQTDSIQFFNSARNHDNKSRSWVAIKEANQKQREQSPEHSLYSLSQPSQLQDVRTLRQQNLNYKDHRNQHQFKNSEIFVTKESRLQLPFFRDPKEKVPMWDILKKSVGQDLSKVSMPVILAEPLTSLQRVCEMLMQQQDILKKAANITSNSAQRLALCTIHGITMYHDIKRRTKKTFNPMLGETYELVMEDFKYISEQVSHHPPISAFHVEGDNFRVFGYQSNSSNFVKSSPSGTMHIKPLANSIQNYQLEKHGDFITVTKPDIKIYNIIFGTMYADLSGTIKGYNHTTGERSEVKLIAKGQKSKIEGSVYDAKGKEVIKISGSWVDQISIKDLKENTTEVIWKEPDLVANSAKQFNLNSFGILLNHQSVAMKGIVAPSDSRFRKDQSYWEEGKMAEADAEKQRLEVKQRANRKARQERGEEWTPRFFRELKDHPYLKGQLYYQLIEDQELSYWDKRNKRDWEVCPDLWSDTK